MSLFSISIGGSESGIKIELGRVLSFLLGHADEIDKIIILQIRFPRILTSIFAGGGLAVAGAILQAIIRNPLAEPYILGISSGSAFGAVVSIALIGSFSFAFTPILALAGSLLVTILVYFLGKRRGVIDINTMLLSGIMTGAFFSALILIIITISNESLKNVLFWLLGNLSSVNLKQSILICIVVLISFVLTFIHSYRLNLLAMGEEIAKQLGIDAEFTKRASYFVASVLTAVIVSITGVIGFIGLVVPHVCRKIFSVDYRILIPTSFFAGGITLLLADTIVRVILYPNELPVGSITALFGAPFFVYLLKKEKSS
ncbi:iron complex transport system permease protein [Candidatus Kryptobacter tengchongensis]|uniref:Iron complex transport system permease protein n=4 Tax=Kryptobacter tengchongensis TaxID=1643429 RepID=A0A916LHR1_KRYT1|nr:iron complex transport system permease protein [Candidatus Kryptobacter tengchongensis]CUS95958.1 iron complex transport system permease protein [Candidatus Kryptobacter tengchongensis]CUU02000.1 iron complex transport system permease protein [Candidatus Kryptobacter tengchongensis]CUU09377.1 iron complex transport system permease protein [Candidatus Kryptobacter tengchongensis]